ncbi:MAG: LacI family transcriptional regulator [Lachnospiraceae bacterium]|nr:LacI family transcriptional regulator [Lachnospiraceae bacterium]
MSLKKIAEMTGVSVSTVSRVLNNRNYNCASEEVKAKIWAAAEEIQYVPNESARNLKKGAAASAAPKVLSLAVILERYDSLDDDPFFRELYRSIEQEAFSDGCTISGVYTLTKFSGISNEPAWKPLSSTASAQPPVTEESGALSKNHPSNHTSALPRTDGWDCIARNAVNGTSALPRSDGYIILGRSSSQILGLMKKTTPNLVAVSRNPTQFEIDEIICDGRTAAEHAMEYLIRKGRRRIGYIGDCSYENRYVGYCDTMIKNALPMDYANIFSTDQKTDSGYRAMKKLLENQSADAVLCANDATALGALRALSEIPKSRRPSIDLISIDDIRAAQEVTPALTTVHIPQEDMGKAAVKILLDRIRKGHMEKMRVEFPSRLVIRESS